VSAWRAPALLALCLLWNVTAPVAAETVDGRRIVIVDGDTIALGRERVRLLNIDAPESFRPRCERELIAGLKAKAYLAELLRAGPVVITRTAEDRYRRTLARVAPAVAATWVTLLSVKDSASPGSQHLRRRTSGVDPRSGGTPR
jgi:endonuclease YncB( thermonuclease family)